MFKNTDFIGAISFRPSARSTFYRRFSTLTPTEAKLIKRHQDVPTEALSDPDYLALDNEHRAHVQDTLMDLLDFKYSKALLKPGVSDPKKQKEALLVSRAANPANSTTPTWMPPRGEEPHRGHGSARAGLLTGHSREEGLFQQLEMRFALHDLLDPLEGSPRYAAIEFANLIGRIQYDRPGLQPKLTVEDVRVFQVYSLAPWRTFEHPLSWRVQLGARRVYDQNCKHCLAPGVEAGGGITLEPFGRGFTASLLGEGGTSYSSAFRGSNARLEAGGRAILSWEFNDRFRAIAEGFQRFYIFAQNPSSWGSEARVRYGVTKSLAVDAGIHWGQARREVLGGVYYYF
jgi:hypothetical protein